MVQIIIMSYYLYSAELPSALLRSKFHYLCILILITNIPQSKLAPSLSSPTLPWVLQAGTFFQITPDSFVWVPS